MSSPLAKILDPTILRLILKSLSLGAGAFLVIAGVLGCSAIILGGGFVYFVGSLYAIVFGLIVLTIEIKDKTRVVSAVYHWLDVYLKFLTLQRGKGAFYLGVGVLVFFMGPTGGQGAFQWGINNVAALFLASVGILHTFYIIKEQNSHLGPGSTEEVAPVGGGDDLGFGSRGEWNEMVQQAGTTRL